PDLYDIVAAELRLPRLGWGGNQALFGNCAGRIKSLLESYAGEPLASLINTLWHLYDRHGLALFQPLPGVLGYLEQKRDAARTWTGEQLATWYRKLARKPGAAAANCFCRVCGQFVCPPDYPMSCHRFVSLEKRKHCEFCGTKVDGDAICSHCQRAGEKGPVHAYIGLKGS